MSIGALIAAGIGAGLLNGGTSLIGTIYGSNKTAESVDKTNASNLGINRMNNAFNAEEAAKQRSWEEYMSNTEIQRRMADLQAAGINPALAISGGGASTPGGYAATSSGNAQMKAMDYSPFAKLSLDLGHLVTSAARIEQLQAISKNNPEVMKQLNNVSQKVNRSITNAQKMDSLSNWASSAEAKAAGELVRSVNLWE